MRAYSSHNKTNQHNLRSSYNNSTFRRSALAIVLNQGNTTNNIDSIVSYNDCCNHLLDASDYFVDKVNILFYRYTSCGDMIKNLPDRYSTSGDIVLFSLYRYPSSGDTINFLIKPISTTGDTINFLIKPISTTGDTIKFLNNAYIINN